MRRWKQIWIGAHLMMWGMLGGEGVTELSPYVVEAWHFDQVGSTIPAGVIRVEGSQIRESGVADIAGVLEQLTGVRVRGLTGNGNEGQLALRGFGDNSGLRVLVLVDGQVYNPPDMSGINWTGLSLDEIEAVEVIRGGQGVMYGNHAVSGVVKLRTRDPARDLSGALRINAGSDGARAFSGRIEGTFRGNGLRGGVHLSRMDGYREHSASEAQSTTLTWLFPASGAARWRGRMQWSSQETQFPGPLLYSQFRDNPRQSTSAGEDFSERDMIQATLHGAGEIGSGEWEANAGVLERQTDWTLDGAKGENHHRRLSASPRMKTKIRNGFVISGIDVHGDRLRIRQFLEAADAPVKARGVLKRETAGAYFLGSFDFGDRLNISGGFRREMARTDNDYLHFKTEQLLPFIETNRGVVANPEYRDPPESDPDLSFDGLVEKAGWAAEFAATYSVTDRLTLWSGWDRVYRYPSVDETASFQGYPMANPLNTSLEPETGNNFEAGLKQTGTNWQASSTIFWMRLREEIVFDEELRLNRNIGSTQRKGIELSGSYNGERWGVSGNLSWIQAKFDDPDLAYNGYRIPLVPEVEAGVSVWCSLPGNIRFRTHLQAYGDQIQGNDFFNARRKIDTYTLVSMYLSWVPSTGFRIGASVENLMDKTHAVSAYNGGFYPGSGRRFRAGLTYEF